MRARRIYLKVLPETTPAVKNEKQELVSPGSNDMIDYKKFLKVHFEQAGAQGITVGEMRSRLALLTTLEAATTHLDIEHRDYEKLVKELETQKWARITQNVVTLIDDIKDAMDVVTAELFEAQAKQGALVGPAQVEGADAPVEQPAREPISVGDLQ